MPDVYAGPRRVGTIPSRRDGPAFGYDPGWLAAPDSFPVSLSMPLSGAAWGPERVAPCAQAIGGQRRGRYVFARHWRGMAQGAGLSAVAVRRRVEGLADRILAELGAACDEVAAMPAGGAMLDTFVEEISGRATTVRSNLDVPQEDPSTD